MKRKLENQDDNETIKKQKISKKRKYEDTIFDTIPEFKKLKINVITQQSYSQYKRDILLYI
jgi:hypothetical protein